VARQGELLWPFSMPPHLRHADDVRIADLGTSDAARRARQYREGLALRYGKTRQAICGVHVNVSVGPRLLAALASLAPLSAEEGRTGRPLDGYHLRLARHLYADLPWLVLLTGASPLRGGESEDIDAPALSYRNSPSGYGGREFQSFLDLASLEAYLDGIRRGLRTESAAFARLGLVRDGRILQLNSRVFQREKELYAPIRLRQALRADETTLHALDERGIGYLELRFFDVDPFRPAGLAEETLRLLHLVLLAGLTRVSDPRPNATLRDDLEATSHVALRDPLGLVVAADRSSRALLTTAARRLTDLAPWAEQLDAAAGGRAYSEALGLFVRRVQDPRRLPAYALLCALRLSGLDWTTLGVRLAEERRASVAIPRHVLAARATSKGATHALDHARV
jgi:glutamate--cysteine ligase